MWTDARAKKTAKMSYDSFPAQETIELDPTFLETVVYQDRTYQSYAINNLTYLVPIDEVLIPWKSYLIFFSYLSIGRNWTASQHAHCPVLHLRRTTDLSAYRPPQESTRLWPRDRFLGYGGCTITPWMWSQPPFCSMIMRDIYIFFFDHTGHCEQHASKASTPKVLYSALSDWCNSCRLVHSWYWAWQVIGIDINPTGQPEEMPVNLYLQVDDLNQR
jgi:hypothetical protein